MPQDGIEKFYADLGVNPETDVVVILISQKMGAECMGEYKLDEFQKGCQELNCSSIANFKSALPRLYKELQNETVFKNLYLYTYGYALEKGYKSVDKEIAIALWELLMASQCQFFQKWIEFVTNKKSDLKAINKDTWDQFYDFVTQTKGDLANFVDDGCWPSLVDEFMEFVQSWKAGIVFQNGCWEDGVRGVAFGNNSGRKLS